MTPPQPDEPVSALRILEVALAFALLFGIAGLWLYGWLMGTGLLAWLWYGG